MKYFNSLKEALGYYPKCPVCYSKLEINDDKHRTIYFDNESNDYLCYELMDDDLVVINKLNDSIDFIFKNNLNINYDNAFCVIKSECSNNTSDCLFSYVLLCYFDVKNNKLKNICLCSEQFSIINKNDQMCVINNVYDRNFTEYTIDIFSSSMQVEKLPLVQINFNNPQDALSKIEKLLLFI